MITITKPFENWHEDLTRMYTLILRTIKIAHRRLLTGICHNDIPINNYNKTDDSNDNLDDNSLLEINE